MIVDIVDADALPEYFTFLDRLRESGQTNMFGAGPYLERAFLLNRSEARVVLRAWQETFDGESSADARAAKARAG